MPTTMEDILMRDSSPADHSDTEDNKCSVEVQEKSTTTNKNQLVNRLKSLYKSPPGDVQQAAVSSKVNAPSQQGVTAVKQNLPVDSTATNVQQQQQPNMRRGNSTSGNAAVVSRGPSQNNSNPPEEPAKKKAKIQPQPSIQIIHEAVTPSDVIIVSVGTDDKMQKFQCSRTILSFTNRYFSGMLKSGMEESINNEVKFPDGDPEGWKIFCEEFASPDILGKLEHNHRSKINKDNVEKLIHWFDKFEMNDHLKQCDKVISGTWNSWMKFGDFWVTSQLEREDFEAYQTRLKERETLFDEAFAIFQYANRYKLKDTLKIMGDGMASLMKDVPLATSDLFDKQVMKVLLNGVGPFSYSEEDGLSLINEEGCACKALWNFFKKIIKPHTACLSQGLVDHQEAFPALVWSFKQNMHTEKIGENKVSSVKRENKKDRKAARCIINKILKECPDRISRELPCGRSMGSAGRDMDEKICEYGERKFKEVLKKIYTEEHSEDFSRLNITLPQEYNES